MILVLMDAGSNDSGSNDAGFKDITPICNTISVENGVHSNKQ